MLAGIGAAAIASASAVPAETGGPWMLLLVLWLLALEAAAVGVLLLIVGSDGVDRVTHVDRAVREEFSAIRDLMDRRWFRALGERDRLAIVVKLLRIHVFGLLARRTATAWSEAERSDLAGQVQAILAAAPEVTRVLSRAEANLLDAALDPSTSPERLVALGRRRTRHGRPGTILTRDPRALLDPQAPLRLMIASRLGPT